MLHLPSINFRPDLTAGLRVHGKVVQNRGVRSGGLDLAGVVVGGIVAVGLEGKSEV